MQVCLFHFTCNDIYICHRILICRFHMTIFVRAVWKFCLILWSCVLQSAEVLHLSLLLQVYFCQNQNEYVSKKWKLKREKELAAKVSMLKAVNFRQIKSNKFLRLNFYVVSSMQPEAVVYSCSSKQLFLKILVPKSPF